jgi:hypothetical protein
MNLRISRAGGIAVALLILPLFSFGAAAQLAVSSNDHKAVLVNGVNTVAKGSMFARAPLRLSGETPAPQGVAETEMY